MSRSSLHKRDIKAHDASVKTCRFRSSFVAGLPTDNMLMGTGPDAAAMGNALAHGHGSLSKRAVTCASSSNQWQTVTQIRLLFEEIT